MLDFLLDLFVGCFSFGGDADKKARLVIAILAHQQDTSSNTLKFEAENLSGCSAELNPKIRVNSLSRDYSSPEYSYSVRGENLVIPPYQTRIFFADRDDSGDAQESGVYWFEYGEDQLVEVVLTEVSVTRQEG